jgi:radical SAM protein with 4Fe4S-binding SPASM domain
MKSNVYGASNLQFLGADKPDDLDKIHNTMLLLLDNELSKKGDTKSDEELSILTSLRFDIKENLYNDFIDLDYPGFSITPHEYDWLKCHEQNLWMEYLVYRYKFKMYPIQKKLSNFPVHLLIEPTSICNLRCIMCFQIDQTFSGNKDYMGVMSWNLFQNVVDQAAEHRCHAITLASRGEPTLHKKFGEMLLYINHKGIMDIKINTNVTRLTEKLCHDILSANVATVTLSVDATTKATYEAIRIRGNFDEVLNNIKRFNNIKAKHYPENKTITRIAGVAVSNTQSSEEMMKFWSDYVDQVSIRQEIPRWDSYGNLPYNKESICKLLYERIYVWYDGTCNPCDFDYKSYLALGNANEQPLTDIWLGERYQKLREAHNSKQRSCVVPCDRCPF